MPHHRRRRTVEPWITILAACALILGGCQSPEQVEPGAQPAPAALTDGQISSVIGTANLGEVQEAQVVLPKTTNQAVREFAQRMIAEHSEANQRLDALLNREGIQPAPTGLSQQLQSTTNQTIQSLQNRSGADLDRSYIENQIELHRWLIQTLDNSLIPGARDDDLEEYLRSIRPTLVSHLQHAEQVRAAMGGR